MYLASGASSEDLVFLGGAVELVNQLLDLIHFILYKIQAENAIQPSVILLFQDQHIFAQLGKTLLQPLQ